MGILRWAATVLAAGMLSCAAVTALKLPALQASVFTFVLCFAMLVMVYDRSDSSE